MKKYIDMWSIEDYPVVVLSCDMIGFIPWAIRAVTKDNYNHIMEAHRYGHFASQNFLYSDVPFESYMNVNHKLKVWTIKDITETERLRWKLAIKRDLAQPWYLRLYDFLGVVGHLLHVRWLNVPYRNYCSERVQKHLEEVFGFDIIKHATPAEIDDFLEKHDRGVLLGVWDGDMDITGHISVDIGIEPDVDEDDIDEEIL